ncbi:MAG: sulfur carrier protein ThiS [Verrucomicrobiota bacterium]
MTLFLNGEQRPGVEAPNVAELVSELQLVPATLLIEHNGTALHRHEWASRALAEGDRVEFIRVVAGG